MANVISAKVVKIKPENQATAEGTVVKCKYAGSASFGIGPMAKTTYYYKVFIQIEGLAKPLVLKVKEKAGWDAGIVQSVQGMGRAFGANKPIQEGERVLVTYDQSKPKKCNIAE